MRKITARLVLFKAIILALFLLFFSSSSSFANLSACSASLSPNSIGTFTSGNNILFTITNNDDSGNRMEWVQVTPPSSYFLTEGNTSFHDFSAASGNSINEVVLVDDGNNVPISSQNWIVQASDNPDGIGVTTCTGDLGMSIIDASPPQISGLVVSDITNTSVVISWTTSVNATSELDYGETLSYGLVKTDNNLSTQHSFILDSLSPNKAYFFKIMVTSEMGATQQTGDQTFATAQTATVTLAPQPITITNTITNTKTIIITPTPTPTPIPDTIHPTVYVSTDFSKPFAQPPQVSGTAKDNKAVAKVEYSLDGGKNWLQVDTLNAPNKISTAFSFIPPPLDDGNYDLLIRATDNSGNLGFSKKYTLVIDRLPPQISGVLFSMGPQIINPRADGALMVLENQPIKITLSDVGGATSIDIFVDDTSKLNSKKFSLTKNSESGLWSGNLNFSKEGIYQLRFSAIDGAGNKTDRNLNKVVVARQGRINAKDSKITVYFQDPLTHEWLIWDGKPYLQENPQKTDASGNYSLFLPTGKYYLQIESYGYRTANSDFFTVSSPGPINASFTLKSLKVLLNLGIIKLYWPDFSIETAPFINILSEGKGENSLIGSQAPYFSLPQGFSSDSLAGKPSVLTFINTWSPSSLEQVFVLDKFSKNKNFNSATIVEGEKSSKVYVFQKRGGYGLPIITDPDATLVSQYGLSVLPTTYFLDRKGLVRKVVSGVLNEQELENILTNIAE